MNEKLLESMREAWKLAGEIAEAEGRDQQTVFDEALEEVREAEEE